MKFQVTNKLLNYAIGGGLGKPFLLAGALCTLGAASCGSSDPAVPPTTMTTPGTTPTGTTTPTPYTPPYPPPAPQVQRGMGNIPTTPHVLPVFFTGDKLQNQLYAFTKSYITSATEWQVLQEYGIGFGTVASATVLTQTLSAAITDKDLQNFLNARVGDGSFVLDAQSVVLVFLPSGVVIDSGGEASASA